MKKCVHTVKIYKSISDFFSLAQHLQKYRAPLSHREASVSCSSWCHLPCVDHKVLGNHSHTRPVSIVFLLPRWINRNGLEIKACFSTTHCSHPGETMAASLLALQPERALKLLLSSRVLERSHWPRSIIDLPSAPQTLLPNSFKPKHQEMYL